MGISGPSSTEERIAHDIHGYLAEHERKELLRFVVVGSVDDGKSTLIGRLLFETQGLYDDQIAQVKRASRHSGAEIDFSLFTDGLTAEREQGITIDVAYRYFTTPRRKYIVADTPGHVQYTRNMATGASTADVALILIDARLGVLAQTRRHAYLASLLGIPNLLVAINKMDLVHFEEARYREIEAELLAFTAHLGFASVTSLPLSARDGDNVTVRSERTPWHGGGTLLEFLETVPLPGVAASAPVRFVVQTVLRPDLNYRGFAGQIAAGSLRPGDELLALPSRIPVKVRAIDTFEGEVLEAHAPMSVTLRLTEEVDVSRGDMLVSVSAPAHAETTVDAMLVWLSEQPLDPARAYWVKHTSRAVPAQVSRIAWRIDLETLEKVPAERLALNEIGRVTWSLKRPIICEPYRDNRVTGAFIVIDALTNDTVAAGTVIEGSTAAAQRDREARGLGEETGVATEVPQSRVSREERQARVGRTGTLVSIRGESTAAQRLGYALERALFDAGTLANVVGTGDAAIASAEAGLVSITFEPVETGAGERLRASLRLSGQRLLEVTALEEDGGGVLQSTLRALEG